MEPEKKKKKTRKAVEQVVEMAPVAEETEAFCGFIAPGRSVTSKKGILGPGNKVLPEYFIGGMDTFIANVKTGIIVEK